MAVKVLSAADAARQAVDSLGLDSSRYELSSREALACLLRRAASFRCPTTSRTILRTAALATRGLIDVQEDELADLIDALIACGDLYEVPEESGAGVRVRVLRLGPPRYVRRTSGHFPILGIRSDGVGIVGDQLAKRVQHHGYLRTIFTRDSADRESLEEDLQSHGLRPVVPEQWLRHPQTRSAASVIHEFDQRLDAAPPCSDIPGLIIADLAASGRFYRSRWRSPSGADTGRFVARRPQAYGADLWCYADLAGGEVKRLLDLPAVDTGWKGSDEGIRLMAAIAATLNRPSEAVLETNGADQCRLDLFAPLPSWLQRRLDIVGTPLPRTRGALLSYGLAAADVAEERVFMEQMMWLKFV